LQARDSFSASRTLGEKRIFDLFNLKISEYLKLADYDFMPPSSHIAKMPSQYLRDLVNFLTNVMYKTFDNLPKEIRTFVYFESFDHLATGMLVCILLPWDM
jgi:hypothetical protein